MSTYEDNLLAARFAALAPEPLAGDWDDVLGRAGAARKGRRWLERSRRLQGRRRFLVVLAVALVVAVGTAAAIGSVRDFILDRGFVGVPPPGATPSAPGSGELVVHWVGRSGTLPPTRHGGPIVTAWVYADGRIIWSRRERIPEGANEITSGFLEQRLTPDGVELVRSAVAGLLDRSRTHLETFPADSLPGRYGLLGLVVPNDYGSSWGSVEVPRGDRLVSLHWVGAGTNERTTATPEQLLALQRVDALLTDPTSVLPPSAWAERKVRAYVPSHYAVCITSPPKGAGASHPLSLLPARAADVLRDKSWTRYGGGWARYCYKVEIEEARDVADALSGLDPEPGWRHYGLAYRVAEPGNPNRTRIWFEPYFPHGQPTFLSGPFG